MNVDQLRDFCLAFPEATENVQWSDDLCFKYRGKIFTTVALTAVPQKLCFKCSPEAFAELTEREDIRPAPYVGRYNWVILDRFSALSDDDLRSFIRESYQMVAAKAPKDRISTSKPRRSRTKKKPESHAPRAKSRRRS